MKTSTEAIRRNVLGVINDNYAEFLESFTQARKEFCDATFFILWHAERGEIKAGGLKTDNVLQLLRNHGGQAIARDVENSRRGPNYTKGIPVIARICHEDGTTNDWFGIIGTIPGHAEFEKN